ncbi:hypothetical protein M6B38_109785 [Iris pallida]|uniref:Uncharacterized protein n=1 Tax=Iris pallida TaxID=29817 RepID=A0AAX6E8Q5_IRIPA|nr:hypothetical protein M6B38_109785 [Iris pallida]
MKKNGTVCPFFQLSSSGHLSIGRRILRYEKKTWISLFFFLNLSM